MTDVETLLRTELTRLPEGAPPAAVLTQIQGRSTNKPIESAINDVGDRDAGYTNGPTTGQSKRSTYLMAVAAGAAVLIASVLALTVDRSPNSELRTEPAGDAALDLVIAPPSYWWLVALVLLGVIVTLGIARLTQSRLVAIAVGTLVVGLTIFAAVALSYTRQGAELTARAPDLPGFELIDTELNPWPGLESADWALLTYRPNTPLALTADEDEQLQTIADELGFDSGLPNLGKPCLRLLTDGTRPPGGSSNWSQRDNSDFFCASGLLDGDLHITASRYSGAGVWYRWLLGYPLTGLGLILLLVAVRELQTGIRRPTARQVGYGIALTCYGAAIFMTGYLAIDALRVGSLGDSLNCRLEPGVSSGGWSACRGHVIDVLSDAGALESGKRLYWPVIFVADVLSLMLAIVGWGLGITAIRHESEPSRRRRRLLLLIATAALLLLVTPQLIYGDAIGLTTDVFE